MCSFSFQELFQTATRLFFSAYNLFRAAKQYRFDFHFKEPENKHAFNISENKRRISDFIKRQKCLGLQECQFDFKITWHKNEIDLRLALEPF